MGLPTAKKAQTNYTTHSSAIWVIITHPITSICLPLALPQVSLKPRASGIEVKTSEHHAPRDKWPTVEGARNKGRKSSPTKEQANRCFHVILFNIIFIDLWKKTSCQHPNLLSSCIFFSGLMLAPGLFHELCAYIYIYIYLYIFFLPKPI